MGKWSMSQPDVEKGCQKGQPKPPPPSPRYCPPAKPWFPWLVPLIFVANIAMFVYSMYLNNCPSTTGEDQCLFYHQLKRFSFQPFRENPLLGPSTTTYELSSFSIFSISIWIFHHLWQCLRFLFLNLSKWNLKFAEY